MDVDLEWHSTSLSQSIKDAWDSDG